MSDDRARLIDPASGVAILPLAASGNFPGGTPWGIAEHGDNLRIAIGSKQLDCSTATEARLYRDFARALYKITEGHWPAEDDHELQW